MEIIETPEGQYLQATMSLHPSLPISAPIASNNHSINSETSQEVAEADRAFSRVCIRPLLIILYYKYTVPCSTGPVHSCLEEKCDVQTFLCKNQFNILLTKSSFELALIWLGKYNSGTCWYTECYVGGY